MGPKVEDPAEGTDCTAADNRQRRKGWPSVTNIHKAWGRRFRYIELVCACVRFYFFFFFFRWTHYMVDK